ncbi:hypothetical protein [Polaromonas sp.]
MAFARKVNASVSILSGIQFLALNQALGDPAYDALPGRSRRQKPLGASA